MSKVMLFIIVFVIVFIFLLIIVDSRKNIHSFEQLNYQIDKEALYIESLRKKSFTGSDIKIIKLIRKESSFSSYLIHYDSEGLRISGMMNIPHGEGPFPVVILNHGYYNPKKFSVGLGFKEAADIFARHGYVAVGSDFRNHGDSDKGKNFFSHFGSLYDVLYLVEAVKELPYIDRERIGMWGYSGGGWLTLKAAVINQDIKVIALFGSMSSDDKDNYYTLKKWHPEVLESVSTILGRPDEKPDDYAKLSPMNYFKSVSTKVIIHHGEKDKSVPLKWSIRLKETLVRESKTVEFYTYRRQGHILKGKAWDLSMERTVNFFNQYLKD